MVLVSLISARAKARDAKRLADIRQIGTGLELYFNDCGSYPVNIATVVNNTFKLSEGTGATCGDNKRTAAADGGIALTSSGTLLLGQFPTAPAPVDNTCTAALNSYTYTAFTDAACATAVIAGNLGATINAPCYNVTFCLGGATGGYVDTADAGTNVEGTLSPIGITAL